MIRVFDGAVLEAFAKTVTTLVPDLDMGEGEIQTEIRTRGVEGFALNAPDAVAELVEFAALLARLQDWGGRAG